MSEKCHIPELSGGLSAAGSGSVVGSGLFPSPDSAWTPPASACLSPCAGSQHDPKGQEEEDKLRLLYDSSRSHKFKLRTTALPLSDDQMQRKQTRAQTQMKKEKVAGTNPNLSHGKFLFGSSQILIQSVNSLLMLLCVSCHLLSFLSEGSNLFPVALNVVLHHLIPDIVDTDILLVAYMLFYVFFKHIKC